MRSKIRTGTAVAAALIAGAAAAVAAATVIWNRGTEKTVRHLASISRAPDARLFDPAQLSGLPAPVVRYFRFALTPGQPVYQSAKVEQSGEFRMGGFGAPFQPFMAVEYFTVEPPGFVWDAAIKMNPLLTVSVRDSSSAGVAAMQAKLASVVTVVNQRDRPELNTGALHRYLAEVVWFPIALLPSRHITWQEIDDYTARAVLTYAGASVSAEFHFGKDGGIVSAYVPQRYREVKGRYLLTPWEAHYRGYKKINGMMLPTESDAEWILPEGRLSVGRFRMRNISFGQG